MFLLLLQHNVFGEGKQIVKTAVCAIWRKELPTKDDAQDSNILQPDGDGNLFR